MALTERQKQEAQELFAKGYTTSQVFRHFGAQSIGQESEVDIEESAVKNAATKPALKPLANKITDFLGLGTATQTFGDAIARTRLGAGVTGKDVETNRQFIEAPTGKQLAGAALQTGSVVASTALAPISLPAQVALGGTLGYAYDVGGDLQRGSSTTDTLKPGIGTLVGLTAPLALRGLAGPSTAASADDVARMAAGDQARAAAQTQVGNFGDDVSKLTNSLKDRASGIMTPKKTAEEAMGEVLQGKTKDVKTGLKALKQVDVSGVKTYQELGGRVDKSISALSQKVDEVLGADKTLTPLSNLKSTITSKGGQTVSTNYVETALRQLDELYTTTGDIASKADLSALLQKAQTEGLTKLQINNISRIYNQEFGSKAFSKMGDPLTSVNAQMYENVRKGLKAKAREGMGGTVAEALDKDISALYNTQKLVQKNVEKVNQLQQKIQERGLLEKVGHAVSKGFDMVSGGTVRGLIGGLLPRGAGYKVMNDLDLEEQLAKNLTIIDKALKSGSDDAIIKAVQAVEKTTPGIFDNLTPGLEARAVRPTGPELDTMEKFIDFQRGINLTDSYDPSALRSEAYNVAKKLGFEEKGPQLADKFADYLESTR
jgi:hypothetical protein